MRGSSLLTAHSSEKPTARPCLFPKATGDGRAAQRLTARDSLTSEPERAAEEAFGRGRESPCSVLTAKLMLRGLREGGRTPSQVVNAQHRAWREPRNACQWCCSGREWIEVSRANRVGPRARFVFPIPLMAQSESAHDPVSFSSHFPPCRQQFHCRIALCCC